MKNCDEKMSTGEKRNVDVGTANVNFVSVNANASENVSANENVNENVNASEKGSASVKGAKEISTKKKGAVDAAEMTVTMMADENDETAVGRSGRESDAKKTWRGSCAKKRPQLPASGERKKRRMDGGDGRKRR